MVSNFLAVGLLAGLSALLVSCSAPPAPEPVVQIDPRTPTFDIDQEVYNAMTPGRGRIKVSLSAQKLTLLDSQGRVAIETDCSTGIGGRETPTGSYKILEKIVDKRSNQYGSYVSKETGEVVVAKAWEVSGPPAGTRYSGTPMPYWMRLTWTGYGIHVGEFARGTQSSFGCIRMPEKIQPLIYRKSTIGMPVRVSY